MPMQRELYPKNWNEIAAKVKDEAGWKCEQCDRPCRKPGVEWMDFEVWLYHEYCKHGRWWNDLFELQKDGTEKRKRQRFTLTVAHLDHKPENCDRSNLKALCSVCHLRYDVHHHARSRKTIKGQLELLEEI